MVLLMLMDVLLIGVLCVVAYTLGPWEYIGESGPFFSPLLPDALRHRRGHNDALLSLLYNPGLYFPGEHLDAGSLSTHASHASKITHHNETRN